MNENKISVCVVLDNSHIVLKLEVGSWKFVLAESDQISAHVGNSNLEIPSWNVRDSRKLKHALKANCLPLY